MVHEPEEGLIRKGLHMRAARVVLLPLVVLLVSPALLQADPPGRVARLGYFQGSLSFRPASLDDWAPASANYPLTTGDHIWADDDGRGEIHIGGSAIVRLGPRTALSFLNLDDQTAQMRISEGSLAVTVTRLDEDEVVEVDTPNAAVSLLRPGFYRVDVREDGDETTVTVRHGEAEVTAGGAAVPVRSRDAAVVAGTDDPRYDVREARGPDEWEEWCLDRDRREERIESRRYVSEGVVGYEDLDQYGRWRDDSEYGAVWVPEQVAADWAPYRYGHWAWVPPWGWTWVDDAPWGFAPFHYGRWARRPWGWFWVPGTIVARPVYAPALVAFVGGDDWFVSLSIRGGGVAWFPLGPREVYVPPYRVSPVYMRNVNVTHVTNITQINVTNIDVTSVRYVNRGVAGAVTAVSRETFVGGRAVERAAVVVPPRDMGRAIVRTTVVETLQPRRESIIGVPVAHGPIRRPPERVQERTVVARVVPPAPPAKLGEVGRVPAPRALVRPASPEGRGAGLRPAREGLPPAHTVRAGERPRAFGPEDSSRGRTGTSERPSDRSNDRPATAPQLPAGGRTVEPSGGRDRERAADRPSNERPPTARPEVGERPLTAHPEVAKPPSDERAKERSGDRDRSGDKPAGVSSPQTGRVPAEPAQRPSVDRPPAARPEVGERPLTAHPEVAKPPSDARAKERSGDRDRSGDKPAGVSSPHTGRVPAEPTRPGAATPQTDERPKDHSGQTQEKARDEKPRDEKPRSGQAGHDQAKPKAKPTPKPTPTPKNN
jgi:hypothetical protein